MPCPSIHAARPISPYGSIHEVDGAGYPQQVNHAVSQWHSEVVADGLVVEPEMFPRTELSFSRATMIEHTNVELLEFPFHCLNPAMSDSPSIFTV